MKFILLLILLIPNISHATDSTISAQTQDTSPANADAFPIVKSADSNNYKVVLSDLKVYTSSAPNFTGNVGVGSTNPGKALDVQGTVRATAFQGDGSALTGVVTSPAGSSTELQYKNGTVFGAVTGSAVDSNGNIGIGSATPGTNIDVTGSSRFSGNVAIGTSDLTQKLNVVGVTTNTSAHTVEVKDSSNNTMLVVQNNAGDNSNAGRIGIGTVNPAYMLDIWGNTRINGASLPALTFGNDFKAFIVPTAQSNGSLDFYTNNTKKFEIPVTSGIGAVVASGNLGVGSVNPGQKIDVTGNVRATNFYAVGIGTASPTRLSSFCIDSVSGLTAC